MSSVFNVEAEPGGLAAILGAGSVVMAVMEVPFWPVFMAVAVLVFAASILWRRKGKK